MTRKPCSSNARCSVVKLWPPRMASNRSIPRTAGSGW
jgi:hypothetical protein